MANQQLKQTLRILESILENFLSKKLTKSDICQILKLVEDKSNKNETVEPIKIKKEVQVEVPKEPVMNVVETISQSSDSSMCLFVDQKPPKPSDLEEESQTLNISSMDIKQESEEEPTKSKKEDQENCPMRKLLLSNCKNLPKISRLISKQEQKISWWLPRSYQEFINLQRDLNQDFIDSHKIKHKPSTRFYKTPEWTSVMFESARKAQDQVMVAKKRKNVKSNETVEIKKEIEEDDNDYRPEKESKRFRSSQDNQNVFQPFHFYNPNDIINRLDQAFASQANKYTQISSQSNQKPGEEPKVFSIRTTDQFINFINSETDYDADEILDSICLTCFTETTSPWYKKMVEKVPNNNPNLLINIINEWRDTHHMNNKCCHYINNLVEGDEKNWRKQCLMLGMDTRFGEKNFITRKKRFIEFNQAKKSASTKVLSEIKAKGMEPNTQIHSNCAKYTQFLDDNNLRFGDIDEILSERDWWEEFKKSCGGRKMSNLKDLSVKQVEMILLERKYVTNK